MSMAEQSIAEIMAALARIEANVKTIAGNGADHERRIRALEGRSGKRWDAVSLSLLTAIIVGVAGYLLGRLF